MAPAFALFHIEMQLLLTKALVAAGATKGIVQAYDEKTETLNILSFCGLGDEFLNCFKAVKAFDPTACGRCLGLKTAITVNDFLLDPAFFAYKHVIDGEQIRSAKAIPLYQANNEAIAGILSAYYIKPLHLMPNIGEIPARLVLEIARSLQRRKPGVPAA